VNVRLLSALLRRYQASEPEREAVLARAYAGSSKSDIGSKIHYLEKQISVLETKSGTLLTHISMMIAVTGIMLSIAAETVWYELVLGVELFCYLLLALLCVRGQLHFRTNHLVQELSKSQEPEFHRTPLHIYQDVVIGEYYFREKLFHLTVLALYFLTFALIPTVLYGLFSDEAHDFLAKMRS